MKIFAALSVLAIFIATVLCLVLANKIERAFPGLRSFIAVGNAITFSTFLFIFICLIFGRLKIRFNLIANWHQNLIGGLLTGGIAFAFSGSALIFFGNHTVFTEHPQMSEIINQVLFQTRPAFIEEIGFRLGMATIALYYFGRHWALIVGSLPFGILHLLNFGFGQEIIWEYILGTTVAGLFLTLIFFNFRIESEHY